jgi:hypothetical protein
MYKLLTEEAKKKAEKEYSSRRLSLILMALVVVLVIELAGLFPSFILSSARKIELEERVRLMDISTSTETTVDPTLWLNTINTKLTLLSPALDNARPSDAIEKVISKKSPGIRITSFSWEDDKGRMMISVSGVAQDRQSLLAFENSLNSSKYFSEVTLPVSNLAKDRDINFQLKLSLIKSQ